MVTIDIFSTCGLILNFHPRQGVLRETLDQDVGGAIAHFFNCLVGPESAKPIVEESSGSSEKSEAKTTSVSDYTNGDTFPCWVSFIDSSFVRFRSRISGG